jgi:hypothetical protein
MAESPGSIEEHIDRVVTCDLRGRPYFLPLYEAARAAQGSFLCGLAARRLTAALELGDLTAPTDELLRAARRRGTISVAIGDAGNELGCGLIREEIESILGSRGRCQTCGGSIASAEAADVLVMAAVSNWGAYGVAAALAALAARRAVLPGPDVLRLTLQACTLAGGRNGISDWTDPGSDGHPLDVDLAVLGLLRQLAGSAA